MKSTTSVCSWCRSLNRGENKTVQLLPFLLCWFKSIMRLCTFWFCPLTHQPPVAAWNVSPVPNQPDTIGEKIAKKACQDLSAAVGSPSRCLHGFSQANLFAQIQGSSKSRFWWGFRRCMWMQIVCSPPNSTVLCSACSLQLKQRVEPDKEGRPRAPQDALAGSQQWEAEG